MALAVTSRMNRLVEKRPLYTSPTVRVARHRHKSGFQRAKVCLCVKKLTSTPAAQGAILTRHITPRSHNMRFTFFNLLLSSTLFFCGNAAIAQQSTNPVTQVPQHLEDLSAAAQGSKGGAPQSSPELQSLIKALSGKWSISVKFEPNAAMPNGVDGTGEEMWRAGPGGFTFLEEEHLPTPEGE